MEAVNLSVLCGLVSAVPDVRQLESGRRVAALAVRTDGGDGHATSVPVTVWDPPAWVETLEAGDQLVVVGRVRRRFFATAAGGRGAKTEVEAETVVRGRERRRLPAVRRRIDAALVGLDVG